MSPFSDSLPAFLQDAGALLGFFISLSIGSYLIRDNFLARLAQYILVGAGLGYMAVLAWRNVLWPQLVAPLIENPLPTSVSELSLWELALWQSWLPLLLGLLMWGAGAELLRRPPKRRSGRAFLRLLAVIPAAILGGVGLGVGIAGALQGTLWPQFTAALGSRQVTSVDLWLVRLFTLLITGGVLIHLQFGRSSDANRPSRLKESDIASERRSDLPTSMIRRLLSVWEGLGRRALWLTAGILFARLAAARFSLVLARLDYFLFEFPRSEFWQMLWATLRGGGA